MADDDRPHHSRQHEWRKHGPKRARLQNVLQDLQAAAEFAAAEFAAANLDRDVPQDENGPQLVGAPVDQGVAEPDGNLDQDLLESEGNNTDAIADNQNTAGSSLETSLADDGNSIPEQDIFNTPGSSFDTTLADDENFVGEQEDGDISNSDGGIQLGFAPVLQPSNQTSSGSSVALVGQLASEDDSSDSDESICDLEMNFLEEEPNDLDGGFPEEPDDPEDPDELDNFSDDSSSDDSGDSDFENEENFNFTNAKLNEPIVMTRVPTVREMLTLDLAVMIRHRQTYESLIDSFEAKNVAFGQKFFPTSKKELWRILGRNSAGIVEHVYCSQCGCYINEKRRLGNLAICPNAGCHFQIETRKAKYFITLSLEKQLKHFLETPGVADLLKYRENRTKHLDGAIEDVYDSEGYKKLALGPVDFSMVLNTDGCKIRKGAKLEIYPVFLRLNELPPELRQKHMFLAALYVDTKEPKMTCLLNPVVNHLNKLSETGVLWRPHPLQNAIRSKIKVLCFCVDGKARYQILNMTSHQGSYGCTYCTLKGVVVGESKTMRWPIKPHPDIPRYEDRTHEGMVAAMIQVHNNLQPGQEGLPLPPLQSVLGHKGPTPLMLARDLDLRRSNACDDLHILYLCAAKHITELTLTEAPRVQEHMGYETLCRIIDARLKKIKTPTNISRKPGTCSIKNRKNWKGSEWRNWILYYSVPCLEGLIKKEYITPLEHLSHGAYLLSQDIITPHDIEIARESFRKFVEMNEELYGIERTKLNLHALIHFARCVIENGNLWCYTTFNFESWNHKIIQKILSSQGVLFQIVVRHLILTSLELALLSQEGLSAQVKAQLQKILKKKRLARAVQFSPKVYLLGKVTLRETTEEERQVLENEGFRNVVGVQEFKKTLVRSSVYCPEKYVDPLTYSDNSMVLTYSDTFCSIQSIVRFQSEDGEDTCGLFVKEHSVTDQTPFQYAKHISRLLEAEHNLAHFILPTDIRSLVVKMPLSGDVFLVPLPNLNEID